MAENTNLETEMTEQTAPEAEAKPAGPSLEELAAQVASLTEALNKQKKATDNASSDAAAWKKKYNATLSEAERAEAERQENERQLRAENEALKRDRTVLTATWMPCLMASVSLSRRSRPRRLPKTSAVSRVYRPAHRPRQAPYRKTKKTKCVNGWV